MFHETLAKFQLIINYDILCKKYYTNVVASSELHCSVTTSNLGRWLFEIASVTRMGDVAVGYPPTPHRWRDCTELNITA
jgi:hypothetical protein